MPAKDLTSAPPITPRPGTETRGRDLAIRGAVHGLLALVTYWAVECLFLSVLPWMLTPVYEYLQLHPWFVLLALGVYGIAGAVLGAALGVCLGRLWTSEPAALEMVGPLALALIFIPHAAAIESQSQIPMSIALAAVILMSIREGVPLENLRRIVNNWTVSFAFLFYPFVITEEGYTLKARQVLGVALTLAVFLISYAAYRLAASLRRNLSGWHSAALWAAATAGLLGFCFGVKQQPLLNELPAAAEDAGGHPNLVLITMDTVRADHLSVYGYDRDTTPNLRQLAQEATVFTNAIAAGDMTLSSHASIFTGAYASEHGAHPVLGKGTNRVAVGDEFGLRLPDHSQTLAKILWNRGYQTMAVAANTTFLQHAFYLDQGFRYYSQPNPTLFLARTDPFYLRTDLSRMLAHYYPLSTSQRAYRTAANINIEAFELLRRAKADKKPFFLFLNYMDAHQPYFPLPPYDVRYPGKDPTFSYSRYFAIEFGALSGARPYTDRDRMRDESQYDGGIAYLDACLGDLFKQLKELGYYDHTMVVVTSDHGQSFGEKKLVGHGTSVYQEQVGVPLMIKYPGNREAKVVNDLASHIDILPTVLDALGYPVPGALPGRNLREGLKAPVTVISESFPCDLFVRLNPRFRRTQRAVFRGPFKLIVSTNGKRALYDLSKDSKEEHNLISANPQVAGLLEADVERWLSTLPTVKTSPAVLGKRRLDGFKSMGYLQ